MSVAVIFVTFAFSVLAAVILIVVFNSYYYKAGRGIALICTGFGGQRVVIDGGCLALPFLHSVERVPTNGITLTVQCRGNQSLISADYIRIDLTVEFILRVDLSESGIQRAARVVGTANLNSDDLSTLYKGRLIDSMQAEISRQELTELHASRDGLGNRIKVRLEEEFKELGLLLESAALTHLDQSSPSTLSEENILHVQGMRTISEQVSENRKLRVKIEADAEAAIQATKLIETRNRVEHERKQKEAEINLEEFVNKFQAESEARTLAAAEQAKRMGEEAKLLRQKGIREAEISRDLALRRQEITSLKNVEESKLQSQIELKHKRMEEIKAEAELEESRVAAVHAQEKIQSERERLAAERRKEQALIRAHEISEVNEIETRSEAQVLLQKTGAEAKATKLESDAELLRKLAEAKGRSQMIAAENNMEEKLIQLKLEQEKISVLPEIAKTLGKPLEKIEGIRINHIGGPGWPGNHSGSDSSPFSDVFQSLLSMSLQLPALKKLGEEIGVDIDPYAASRATDAINRSRQLKQQINSASKNSKDDDGVKSIGSEGDDGIDQA